MCQQIAAEVSQIVSTHDDVVNRGNCFRGSVVSDAVGNTFESIGAGNAERIPQGETVLAKPYRKSELAEKLRLLLRDG